MVACLAGVSANQEMKLSSCIYTLQLHSAPAGHRPSLEYLYRLQAARVRDCLTHDHETFLSPKAALCVSGVSLHHRPYAMAEGSHETPILWDDACVPSAEDDEFQNVINCGGKSNFRPGPDQCRRWDKAPNSSTHASFGDDGTTATVNAYGDIVQFGTFIDRGHSGMFSADHGFVAEPYLVDGRTRDLFELSTLNLSSQPEIYGLVIGWRFGDQPQLQWVNYRWPRYEFKDKGKSETTIQCMVHDGVVIQHYTLTNQEDKDAEVTCEFQGPDDEKMQIRDLDHVDPNYRFNERYKDYTATHGPHGYSWILTHKLETSKANGMPIPGSPKVKPSLENQAPMTSQAESVAVVVSVFINGKAVEWGDSEQWKLTIAGTKTNTTNNPDAANVAEVVIAYVSKMSHFTMCVHIDTWRNVILVDIGGPVDTCIRVGTWECLLSVAE